MIAGWQPSQLADSAFCRSPAIDDLIATQGLSHFYTIIDETLRATKLRTMRAASLRRPRYAV